jgi:hypothetical protein
LCEICHQLRRGRHGHRGQEHRGQMPDQKHTDDHADDCRQPTGPTRRRAGLALRRRGPWLPGWWRWRRRGGFRGSTYHGIQAICGSLGLAEWLGANTSDLPAMQARANEKPSHRRGAGAREHKPPDCTLALGLNCASHASVQFTTNLPLRKLLAIKVDR